MGCLFAFKTNEADIIEDSAFRQLSDYQKNIVAITDPIHDPTTFAGAFAESAIGVPIPYVGGFIKADMDLHENMQDSINVAVDGEVPGYSREVHTVGGREVTFYTDATNRAKEPFQTTEPRLSPKQIERYQEDYDQASNASSASAMESRDNFIAENNVEEYESRLHEFLNDGLIEGLYPMIQVNDVTVMDAGTGVQSPGHCAVRAP